MYPAAPACLIRSLSFISISSFRSGFRNHFAERTGSGGVKMRFFSRAESEAPRLQTTSDCAPAHKSFFFNHRSSTQREREGGSTANKNCAGPAIGSPLPNLRGSVSIAP
jgi:hypothetical protein